MLRYFLKDSFNKYAKRFLCVNFFGISLLINKCFKKFNGGFGNVIVFGILMKRNKKSKEQDAIFNKLNCLKQI